MGEPGFLIPPCRRNRATAKARSRHTKPGPLACLCLPFVSAEQASALPVSGFQSTPAEAPAIRTFRLIVNDLRVRSLCFSDNHKFGVRDATGNKDTDTTLCCCTQRGTFLAPSTP